MAQSHGKKVWHGDLGYISETRYLELEFWATARNALPKYKLEGLSIASDYYSLAGNRFARAKRSLRGPLFFAAPFLGLAGLASLWRAYRIVNFLHDAVPLNEWNADQLDVGASVMYRCRRFKLTDEMACQGMEAYNNHPMKRHTLAFLKLHILRLELRNGKFMQGSYGDVQQLAMEAERDGELAQASRIYKGLWLYGRAVRRIYPGRITAETVQAHGWKARSLAEESGAKDQELKIAAAA